MDKLARFGWAALCTFFIWLSVFAVDVIGHSAGLTNFAVVMALLSSLALWLVMGLAQIEGSKQPSQEKAKRDSSSGDARLALLLELMGEDERQALKQRLMDDLGTDGEAVSLAELLAAQEGQSRQRRS